MSVANRYKVLTLSGSQCFAMLRAIATRETTLLAQFETGRRCSEDLQLLNYLQSQLDDIRATRGVFNGTPFTDSGWHPHQHDLVVITSAAGQPKPIQLDSQKHLFEVGAAMEDALFALEQRIRLFGPNECDTIENLTERRDAVKAAYDIVRRAF